MKELLDLLQGLESRVTRLDALFGFKKSPKPFRLDDREDWMFQNWEDNIMILIADEPALYKLLCDVENYLIDTEIGKYAPNIFRYAEGSTIGVLVDRVDGSKSLQIGDDFDCIISDGFFIITFINSNEEKQHGSFYGVFDGHVFKNKPMPWDIPSVPPEKENLVDQDTLGDDIPLDTSATKKLKITFNKDDVVELIQNLVIIKQNEPDKIKFVKKNPFLTKLLLKIQNFLKEHVSETGLQNPHAWYDYMLQSGNSKLNNVYCETVPGFSEKIKISSIGDHIVFSTSIWNVYVNDQNIQLCRDVGDDPAEDIYLLQGVFNDIWYFDERCLNKWIKPLQPMYDSIQQYLDYRQLRNAEHADSICYVEKYKITTKQYNIVLSLRFFVYNAKEEYFVAIILTDPTRSTKRRKYHTLYEFLDDHSLENTKNLLTIWKNKICPSQNSSKSYKEMQTLMEENYTGYSRELKEGR